MDLNDMYLQLVTVVTCKNNYLWDFDQFSVIQGWFFQVSWALTKKKREARPRPRPNED